MQQNGKIPSSVQLWCVANPNTDAAADTWGKVFVWGKQILVHTLDSKLCSLIEGCAFHKKLASVLAAEFASCEAEVVALAGDSFLL